MLEKSETSIKQRTPGVVNKSSRVDDMNINMDNILFRVTWGHNKMNWKTRVEFYLSDNVIWNSEQGFTKMIQDFELDL